MKTGAKLPLAWMFALSCESEIELISGFVLPKGKEGMFKTVRITALVTASLVGSGCATIVGDSRESLSINSSPDDAEVTITNQSGRVVQRGDTPMTVTLDKSAGYFDGEEYKLEFQKDGFESQVVTVSARPNGWYLAGNILFGGLIGWFVIDPATGAMWTLSPDEVNTQLPGSNSAEAGSHIKVVMIEDVPEGLHDEMKPVEVR